MTDQIRPVPGEPAARAGAAAARAAPAERAGPGRPFAAPPERPSARADPGARRADRPPVGERALGRFLAVLIVVLFVIVYYFYELGVPRSRRSAGSTHRSSPSRSQRVERGYNLFEANCARCHGDNGQGGIGPVLNDQMKLLTHLTSAYIKTS